MLKSSMTVGLLGLMSGITGILVETTIAAKLGLSRTSDTFYVAFTVPFVITNLLSATGQFSLVPFFASLERRDSSEELWKGLSYAVNVIFLGLGGIALVGAAGSPWLVRAIAPGYSGAQIETAAHLARWLFLVIVPAGVAEVLRSFLLSQRRFALPSAAGFFRNATVIASVLLTFHRLGTFSIVVGYFAGYALQFAVLAAQTLASFSVRYTWTLRASGEAFRNLRGAGSAQVGAAVAWQGVVIVERAIASFLPEGTLTALNWCLRIMTTLAELLAGSVGTVALPTLSKSVAQQAVAEERRTARATLEIGLALVSPVAVFCLLLDRNIIRLVFERGSFTPEATASVAVVFFYYSLSLLPYSFIRVLTFHLFARNESGAYFRLALFLYGLTVCFDLFYVGALGLGAKGIPLGLLTGSLVTMAVVFRRNIADSRASLDAAFGRFAAKNFAGAAVATLTVWGLAGALRSPATGFGNFLYLCAVCGAGSLVFFGALAATRAVRISEVAAIWQRSEDS